VKLGSLELSSPFMLSPLESVSDAAFRRLCWSLGAGFTWTEMIRARGLVRNNRSTIELIDSFDADVPTGLQLMVANEKELDEALTKLDALAATTHPHLKNLRAVDLNFGCPSPEVIKVGAGPALLKRHHKLKAIFQVLRSWKQRTELPIGAVTAKVRLGLNRAEMDQKVVLPIVELANELLDGLTVHARHAREESTTPAHWEAIAEVKQRATVPIIGNGDVVSLEAAQKLMRESGCDGVMVARGAIRSPWIFRELTGRGPGQPTLMELDVVEAEWTRRATELQSKPKYFEWHREGFRRLRARLSGQVVSGTGMPANEHMR
jgi:tRNA-dihydrouridine synthase B